MVFFFYSFSSQAELLTPGETSVEETVTEHLGEGHIDTVTKTTTIIENKTTGDLLDSSTGVVATRYEGDMDQDWGGLGPASMPNCNAHFGTGTCGKGTSSSLTTFDQYVDISEFHISDGGALEWELQMYHSQNNTTGYFETKGYNNNELQWESGQINLENTGSPETFTGTHDFTGELDKVFIRIGGKKNYFFDNVAYTVNYNVITTTVETWVEIVQPMQMNESLTLEMIETYEIASPEQQQEMDNMMQDMDMVVHIDLGTAELGPDMQIDDMPMDMPQDTMTNMDTMFQDMDVGNMSFDEVMQEVEVAVAEIENVGMEVETIEIKMPNAEKSPTEMSTEGGSEDLEVSTQPGDTKVSENSTEAQETLSEENVEENIQVSENVVEKPVVEEKTEAKEETAQEEAPKEEVAKEESKEEAPAEKVEKTEEQPKEVAENKPTKEQVSKQEKAKRIMTAMASSYDPVAQMTTLALVNALGPDISSYSNQVPVVQPSWYETKDIYQNTVLPDPLGSYISVSSSLQMEKMVSQQYE